MNRHNRNWSVMGPGEKEQPTDSKTPTEQYYYDLLKPKLMCLHTDESFQNMINAIIRLKKDFDI